MAGKTTNLNDIVKNIRGVAYVLDNVEVKGRANMDILLGSMQRLERIAQELESSFKAMNEPEVKVELVEEGDIPNE